MVPVEHDHHAVLMRFAIRPTGSASFSHVPSEATVQAELIGKAMSMSEHS